MGNLILLVFLPLVKANPTNSLYLNTLHGYCIDMC
jgi:hypothetical protein